MAHRHLVLAIFELELPDGRASELAFGGVCSSAALPDSLASFRMRIGVSVALGKALGWDDARCAAWSAQAQANQGRWLGRECDWSAMRAELGPQDAPAMLALRESGALAQALSEELGLGMADWLLHMPQAPSRIWEESWDGFEAFFAAAESASLALHLTPGVGGKAPQRRL